MRQSEARSRRRPAEPAYRPLLLHLAGDLDRLVEAVARDVAQPNEDPVAVAREVRPAVQWTLEALAETEQLSPGQLAVLDRVGRQAAIDGESVQRLLDRYLSTGWVVWEAAAGEDVPAQALTRLGTALLKAGDSAAAAIAQGYGTAERELALRAAAARREFADELLDLPPGDAEGAARLRRRAETFAFDPTGTYRVLVVALEEQAGDSGPDLDVVARAVEGVTGQSGALSKAGGAGAPPDPSVGRLVTARRGRLVIVMPAGPTTWGTAWTSVETTLEALAPRGWLAVAAAPVIGLARVSEAYADAAGAFGVAQRLGRNGLVAANELLLERALLVDESLLALAVGRELGPILGAPRNGAVLLATLDAFIEAAGNLRATARALGVAPRTVGYRVARIEALIGEPLAGPRLVRLTAATFGYRLLPPSAVKEAANAAVDTAPRRDPSHRALSPERGRSRRVPPGRSRRRRSRGRAT